MAIRWIDEASLLLLHDESLTRFGGAPGLRDSGLLSSALARPQAKAAYDSPDLAALGAAYAFGVARNANSSTATSARRFLRSACSLR